MIINIAPAIKKIHECLNSENLPKASPDCDYCAYVAAVQSSTKPPAPAPKKKNPSTLF